MVGPGGDIPTELVPLLTIYLPSISTKGSNLKEEIKPQLTLNLKYTVG